MAKFLNLLKLRGFTSPSDAAVEISAATDSASASRLRIDAGGKLTWGDGTTAGDTNLYRTIANTLKTDDYLVAEGGLTVEAYQVTTVGASAGNALVFDGTKFAPGAVSGGGAAGSTYVADIGNGASTTFVVTHGLNTRDVFVQARNAASPYEVIDVQWEATSTSTVTFNFSTPPASNSVRVAIYSAVTGDNVVIPLDGLTDVTITTPEEFQSLTYDGVNWTNSYAPVVTYVRNVETTTITTGTCVYLYGANGDHATVKRADNGSDTTSSKTIGVAGADILASENGPIVTRGYVDGIDLSVGYTAGDVLWLGENGAFTTTKPTAPDHLVFIGVVVRATNNGIIYVATQNGYELDELHNVSLPSPSAGEFLKYNGSLWVADAIDLGTDTTGDYVQQISAGTGVTVTGSPSEAGIPIVSIGQAIGTSDSPTFAGITVGTLLTPAMYYSSMNSGRVSFGTTTASASAQVTIKSSNMTYAPLVLQSAMSQSANLQEWQDPTNLPLAFVSSTGSFTTYAGMTGASVSATTINKGATLASDTGLTLLYGTVGAPSQNADINVTRGSSATVGIRWNETTDKWQFTNDGTTYKDLGSGGITVSDTAPSTPATGDLWYESDTGSTYVYYDSYWIEIGGSTAYDQIIGSIQAKGDLLAGTASQAIARLAVGADGTRLAADSSATTGVAWVADTQNTVVDAKGDLLVGLADNTVGKLTVGSNGQILVADSSQTTGVGWTNVNTRNLLNNGAMQIAQRGLSLAGITGAGYQTADRWRLTINGSAGTWTQSVTTGVAGTDDLIIQAGFKNYLKMFCSSSVSLANSADISIEQRLEGQDLQAIAKGTSAARALSLSFWVKSNVTGTYILWCFDSDNSRMVSVAYTISVSGVWEYKTLVIPADTTGLLDNDSNESLRIRFYLGAGTDFTSGTLQTTWGSAAVSANRAVGQVNVGSTLNNYWQITGVQLNVGAVAAPFEFKSFGNELRECQRYYEHNYGFGYAVGSTSAYPANQPTTSINGYTTASQQKYIYTPLLCEKRAFPSITIYDMVGNNGKLTTLDAGGTGTHNVNVGIASTTHKMVGYAPSAGTYAGYAYFYVANAEL